jgi:hypothetical protein
MENLDIQELIDKATRMATTPIGGARGITSSQRGLMGDVAKIGGGIYNNQMDTDIAKRGQDITQAGQSLTAATVRRGQDLDFGLGKEQLGLEKEKATMPFKGSFGINSSPPPEKDWGSIFGEHLSLFSKL